MRNRVAPVAVSVAVVVFSLSGCAASGSSDDPEHVASFAVDYTIARTGVVHAVETINYDFGSSGGSGFGGGFGGEAGGGGGGGSW